MATARYRPPFGDGRDSAGAQLPDTEFSIEQARRRDPQGFAHLYQKLAPPLYAWICLRVHRSFRDQLDPEDVLQEVWWRAMDAFRTFDPAKGPFRAWIFRIATNVLLEGFRRLHLRERVAAGPLRARWQTLPKDLAAQATSISRQVARNEDLRGLVDAISALEDDDRALFAHCAIEGLKTAEAAQLIGISEQAAAKRWQRLRKRIRESATWRVLLLEQG